MRKISLDQLPTLFVNGPLPLVLKADAGEGSLSVFDLEEGLQLRFWDCRLNCAIEVYNSSSNPDEYFHLVFFLHSPGLHIGADRTIQRNSIWDTIFFSSSSNLKIIIPPLAPIQWLSMSFSKEWLNKNLSRHDHNFRTILKKLIADPTFCVLECMNLAEKKNVFELSAMATSEGVASFYIKSTVLKIISNFFLKLVEDKVLDSIVPLEQIPIDEIEKYLSDHLTSFKTIQEIAKRFSMSEAKLKKLFKSRYGTSISAFLTNKRMELAKQYVDEQKKTLQEVARILGYKNVRHFIAGYKRYFNIEE